MNRRTLLGWLAALPWLRSTKAEPLQIAGKTGSGYVAPIPLSEAAITFPKPTENWGEIIAVAVGHEVEDEEEGEVITAWDEDCYSVDNYPPNVVKFHPDSFQLRTPEGIDFSFDLPPLAEGLNVRDVTTDAPTYGWYCICDRAYVIDRGKSEMGTSWRYAEPEIRLDASGTIRWYLGGIMVYCRRGNFTYCDLGVMDCQQHG